MPHTHRKCISLVKHSRRNGVREDSWSVIYVQTIAKCCYWKREVKMCTRKIKTLHLTSNGIHKFLPSLFNQVSGYVKKWDNRRRTLNHSEIAFIISKAPQHKHELFPLSFFTICLYRKIFIKAGAFHVVAVNKTFQLNILFQFYARLLHLSVSLCAKLMTKYHEIAAKLFSPTTALMHAFRNICGYFSFHCF